MAEPGSAPQFVAALEPDNPLAIGGVADPASRHTADFQVTPDGEVAAFISGLSLTGYENDGHSEIFRYDAQSDSVDCVSCAPTNARATGDASLAGNGLSVTDDGRVFFTSSEALALRDTNGKKDAYEWAGPGEVELISSGTSGFDSGLLSVTSDGRDAFFFTRDSLSALDQNGALMKIYDARESGGFFVIPPPPGCAASDECHGAGTAVAPPPDIASVAGKPGNFSQDCSSLSRRAKKSSNRSEELEQKAKRASSPKRARKLRRRASQEAKKASRLSGQAKACRRSSGGNG
jgi:hypothetical protein